MMYLCQWQQQETVVLAQCTYTHKKGRKKGMKTKNEPFAMRSIHQAMYRVPSDRCRLHRISAVNAGEMWEFGVFVVVTETCVDHRHIYSVSVGHIYGESISFLPLLLTPTSSRPE